jgi:hypothetical protein
MKFSKKRKMMHEPGDLRIVSEGEYLVGDAGNPSYFYVKNDSPCIVLNRLSPFATPQDDRYVVLMNDKTLIVEQRQLKIGDNNATVRH